MNKQLACQFADISQNPIVLVNVNQKDHSKINFDILKFMISKKGDGFYINLNLPQERILELLNAYKIDYKRLYLVSCKNEAAKMSNSSFIKSPENLTELSVILGNMNDTKRYRFLVLDSINTLLIYNQKNTVMRFLHFLIGKMRSESMPGVIIAMPQENNKEIVDEISQFCDKTIAV